MARVLVTRPEPAARETARRLRALGHEAIVLPLTETSPLPGGAIGPGPFDAVAVTSGNALRHADKALLASIAGTACFAVGERSAALARDIGFEAVIAGGGNASALAALLSGHLPAGSRVLYLCGRVRRPEFEAALVAASIDCVAVETYDTRPVEPDIAGLRAAGPVDFALAYSPKGAAALAGLARRHDLAGFFDRTWFACISAAAARALGPGLASRARIAGRASEDAVFDLLTAC